MLRRYRSIAGTPVFDGELAQRGYALNRMCFSLNRGKPRGFGARRGGLLPTFWLNCGPA